MSETREFDIGDNHYTVIPHKTTEGTRLIREIYASLAEPGVGLIDALAKARQEVDLDDEVGEAIMKHVDLENLGPQIRAALQALDEEVIRDIFAKTTRNGKDLSDQVLYDKAFAANWTEWAQAMLEIVKVNGFLDFLFMFAGGK